MGSKDERSRKTDGSGRNRDMLTSNKRSEREHSE